MAGPRADLGGTRLPKPRKSTPAPTPPSSSAGARGPVRGKPEYIQKRRRIKGAKQGARLTRQNTIDSQPSGRGRGRQDTPARDALAALRAERVYGDSERATLRTIRNANVLKRAQDQFAARNDKPSGLSRALSDVGDVLGTEIPGSKTVANLATKAAIDRQFGQGAAEKITDAAGREPYEDDITVAEAALAAAPLGAGKAIKAGTIIKTSRAGKAAGRAASKVKAAPKAAAKATAKKAATKAPKTASKVKGAGAAAKRSAAKAKASPAGKVAAKTASGTKKVYRSKPAAPVRVPIQASSRHPAIATGTGLEAPALASAAANKDKRNVSDLTAPIRGTAKGIWEEPRRTAATTAHSIIGMIPAAKGLIENTGLSAGRAAANASGLAHFSGEEIAAPTKETLNAVGDMAKRYAEVYGSGDADEIAKATQEEFGAGMILPLIGAGRARKVHKDRIADDPESGLARKIPERVPEKVPVVGGKKIRAVGGKHAFPVAGKKLKKRRQLKTDERQLQRGSRSAVSEGSAVSHPVNKILGIAGSKRRVKGDIEIRRPDGTVQKAGAEDLIPVIVDTGATKPAHIFEEASARETPTGIAPGRLTKADAAQLLRENPELWDSPQVQKAVQYVRENHPKDTDSLVKVLESSRVTAGIKHPWERYTQQRDAILKKNFKDPDNPSQLELDGMPKKDLDTLEAIDAKAVAEANAETLAWIEKTGRKMPVYMRSINAEKAVGPRPTAGAIGASPHGTAQRPVSKIGQYRSEAKLNKRGVEDVSWRTFEGKTLFESRAAPELNASAAAFIEGNAETFPILTKDGKVRARGAKEGKVLSDEQLDNWVKAEERAGRDPSRYIFLDSQTGKAAFYDSRAGRLVDYGKDLGDFSEGVRAGFDRLAAERGAGITKGVGFVGMDRVHGEAFLSHYGRMGGWRAGVSQATVPVQRVASKAILGYSPSWLIAQPIAEGLQGLAAVGPINQLRGHRLYKKLDKETQRRVDALAGGAIGTGSIERTMNDIAKGLGGGNQINMSHAWGRTRAELLKTPEGRFVDSILTGRGASMLDKRKAAVIRRNVMMGHMVREYQTFTGSLKRAFYGQDALDVKMKGMTPTQRAEFITKNPKAAARIEGYLDDVMGNWTALTQSEKALSGVVIFYPFVRMATEWIALTYPARHPMKAAALQFLGQVNAQEVERLLGGRPSFLSGYAYNPIYGGTDDELGEATTMSPLGPRIAIGSNPVIEAAGSEAGLIRGGLGATNPVINAAISSIGGYDPLTGRSQLGKYEVPELGQIAGSFLSTLAKMPAPLRVFDEHRIPVPGLEKVTGQRLIRKVAGKTDTEASKAYRSIEEEQGDRFLRKIFPGIPVSTALEREKAEVGRLMKRAYAMPQDFDVDAAISRARHDLAQGRGEQAQAEMVKVYDSIVAYNRLERFYKQKGVASESTKDKIKSIVEDFNIPLDQAEALVYGQSKMTPLFKGVGTLATEIEKTGIPLRRIRKARRRRAREIMGYNESVQDSKERRAR